MGFFHKKVGKLVQLMFSRAVPGCLEESVVRPGNLARIEEVVIRLNEMVQKGYYESACRGHSL